MSIKRDRFGKAIDHYTNTVADAAAFEAYYNSEPEDRPSPADFMDYESDEPLYSVGESCPDCLENNLALDDWETGVVCAECGFEYEFQEEEEEDDCMCSDPCCPCSGFKRGVP
jgi:hypothetical protein